MKSGMKRWLNLLLILGTLVIVLLIVLNDSDWGSAVRAVRNLGWQHVLLCVLCYLGFLLMDALSVRFFLSSRGYHIALSYAFFVSIAGQYYSNITPGASGGQPMQIYYLHKRSIPMGVATSALVVRFVSYQLMLSVIGTVLWIAYGPFVAEQIGSNRWILIVGYVYNTVMVAGLVALVFSHSFIRKLVSGVIHIGSRLRLIKHPEETRAKWLRTADTFHESISLLRQRPLELIVQLLLGGAQLMSLMSLIYFIYRGLGLNSATYGQLVTMHVMEYLSAAYAPLPGASGAQEAVFSLYFGKLFPDGTRLAALLLWRFFSYYISLILGGAVVTIVGLRSGKSLREISHITEVAEQEVAEDSKSVQES